MGEHFVCRSTCVLVLALAPAGALAQTATFHLHRESSKTAGLWQLKSGGPDAGATTIAIDFRNQPPADYLLKAFDTIAGVPGASGVIPARSPVTFALWMRKTASAGTLVPRAKLRLNSASGPPVCDATGPAPLTTSMALHTFTCSTAANVTVAATDRLYLWTGVTVAAGAGNTGMKAELHIEGTLNGNYDSQLTVPLPIQPPAIAGISPATGGAGTPVVITGSNFGALQGVSVVTFSGAAAATASWSGTSITASVPTAATTGSVVVTVRGLPSNAVAFAVPPAIASVSPVAGAIGSPVTVSGSNFGAVQGAGTLSFNGVVAAPTAWSASSITAPVPAGAASGPVTVTVGGLASNAVPFTVAPSIEALSPDSGPIGTVVTIRGGGFGAAQGSSTAAFGGVVAAPTSWSASAIAAPVPTAAASGDVVVTVGGLASNAMRFVVPPVIADVWPSSSRIGGAVTITGSNFGTTSGSASVTIGGVAATATRWSMSSIDIAVPAGATSGNLIVSVGGHASNPVPFTVVIPGSIGGVVVRTDASGPIPDATVVASAKGTIVDSAITAADGTYTIGDLDPGVYDLTVAASGYPTEQRSSVGVSAGAKTDVDVAMVVPGIVAGTVTNADGSMPIAGATVRAIDAAGEAGAAITDSAGAYTIASLRPGNYTIQASSLGTRSERPAAVAENVTTTVDFALDTAASGGPVAYAYDALGRLVQVIDSTGDFAVYRYDAVGNIVAIDRPGGGVSIGGFAPTAGSAGDPVIIVGGGFGPAGQNVVTFNGAVAAASSETPTQLTVSVPPAATTGPIAVTAPAGSATSALPFTVAINGGRPVITGLNPAIGVTGTVFTVTGANFDAAAGTDRVDVNGRVASVSAAASSALTTSVPSAAMGGRVTVTTPFGGTVSDMDFVVVPPPYGPSDVDAVDRLTIGASRTITISTPNRIGLLLFDGVSGQRVSFVVSNSTIGAGSIAIYRPDAVQLAGAASTGTNAFIDSQVLPITGTYTIEIDPASTLTGSVTLVSYDLTDVIGSIPVSGASVPVSIVAPGQNAFLSFAGAAGQLVSVTATSSVWTSCQFGGQYSLAILNPDGSLLGGTTNACGATTILDRQTLPVTGLYTLRLDPYGMNTGTATLAMYVFSDVSGPIVASGPSVPVSITVPGQLALLTFSGTAGQVVSVASTSSTWTSCQFGGQYSVGIVKPDGSWLVNYTNACGATTYIDRVALPTTGTYTVKVDPYGAITGSTTITLFNVDDVTGPIALDGSAVSIPITSPSQNALLTFNGSAGQIVSAFAATPWGGCIDSPHVNLWLFGPDGSMVTQTSDACTGGTTFVDHVTLPVSGAYTLMLDPVGMLTGTATVWAYTFADVSGTIVPNGSAVPVAISMPGQNAALTFNGAAGQVVTASVSTPWTGCLDSPHFLLKLLAPNGSILSSPDDLCTGGRASTGRITLPADGAYTLVLDPRWTRTGVSTLTLTSP